MIRRPIALLLFLTALNFANYIDRFLVSAVLKSVQTSVGLSKEEAGLLATVFLLGFFISSPVFGYLGDRVPRKWLVVVGAVLWSIATITSGTASTKAGLFFSRALVGVGEASFTALAPTLIQDVAPSDKKASWQSIFQIAGPVGAALGYVLGGHLDATVGWRHAFIYTGIPGIALALLGCFMAEPVREGAERVARSMWADAKILVAKPIYVSAVLGYLGLTFTVGGFAHWAPYFLNNRYGVPVAQAAKNFGTITVVGGAIATLLGGYLGTKAENRCPPGDEDAKARALLRMCGIGSLFGAPLFAAAFFAPTPTLFLAFGFLAEIGVFLSTGPINVAIFRAVPPAMKATALALTLFAIHAGGDLISPWLVGRLADTVQDSQMALAMIPLPIALGLGGIVWFLAGRSRTTAEVQTL